MRIPRFFLASTELPPTGRELTIAHRAHVDQIRNVLRLKKGARIDVLDMHCRIYQCEIDELTPNVVRSKIISSATAEGDPPVDLTVGLALIKGDRFEMALQKLTEIGVRKVVPVETRHCVVRGDDTTGDAKRNGGVSKRLLRWEAIAREAAEQCERASIPQIVKPVKLSKFLFAFTTGGNLDIAFICAERTEARQLHDRLHSLPVTDKKSKTSSRMQIGLLIGPEGGFTEEEVVSAQNQGWEPVSLGPRILRAETAAIISAAQIICTFES
jgi:16S rRNA (uracil1498-N3)-methyltransferase